MNRVDCQVVVQMIDNLKKKFDSFVSPHVHSVIGSN